MGSYFTRSTKRFAHAVQGVAFLLRTQANARLHLLAAGLVAALGAAVIGVLVFVPHLADRWR